MSVSFYHYDESTRTFSDEVNVSNINARAILAALDIPWDDCGGINREDLIARCEIALAIGTYDEYVRPTVTVGNYTEFGADSDYLVDRITRIRDLAATFPLGSEVTWA